MSVALKAVKLSGPVFREVSHQQLMARFGEYSELIDLAMQESHRQEDCLMSVMRALGSQQARLVAIERDGTLLATVVLEYMRTKDGYYLNVWGVGGGCMDEWLHPLQEYLAQLAQQLGLDGIIMGGRPGWERALRGLGWRKKAVIMEYRV